MGDEEDMGKREMVNGGGTRGCGVRLEGDAMLAFVVVGEVGDLDIGTRHRVHSKAVP